MNAMRIPLSAPSTATCPILPFEIPTVPANETSALTVLGHLHEALTEALSLQDPRRPEGLFLSDDSRTWEALRDEIAVLYCLFHAKAGPERARYSRSEHTSMWEQAHEVQAFIEDMLPLLPVLMTESEARYDG
jgi:hypothetical protein